MSKKMKSLMLVILAIIATVCVVACGKVHNEISELTVTFASVGNTENFLKAENVATNQIDVKRSYCCETGDNASKYELEPYFDGWVKFTIKNNLNYDVSLSHFYFVVKNYYGGGNDYVSPNIAFIGDSYIGGNKNNDGSQGSNFPNEITTWGQISESVNSAQAIQGQRFVGATTNIEAVGAKNIIFYLTAISKSGESLTFTRSIGASFVDVNQCEDDHIPCYAQNGHTASETLTESNDVKNDVQDDIF